MTDEIREPAARPTVHVKIEQAYDLDVSVEFLPSREIPSFRGIGCQPRQGAERVDEDPLDLPEATRKWMVDVNDAIVAWLARDAGNRTAFVADPLRALGDAGIEVDREHAKALARARENAGAAEAVWPGLQLRSVTSTAKKKGRPKPVAESGRSWSPPKLRDAEGDDGCDCEDDEKGRD